MTVIPEVELLMSSSGCPRTAGSWVFPARRKLKLRGDAVHSRRTIQLLADHDLEGTDWSKLGSHVDPIRAEDDEILHLIQWWNRRSSPKEVFIECCARLSGEFHNRFLEKIEPLGLKIDIHGTPTKGRLAFLLLVVSLCRYIFES